jgi:lipopolysaccharide export system permease protein
MWKRFLPYRISQRYLVASFLAPFCLCAVFFIVFLLTFQLFRIIKLVINNDIDKMAVLGLVSHIGVSFLPVAIPLSAFFAVIYTLNKLSEDSELIALKSFGLNKYDLFAPLFIASIVIGLTLFSLNKSIIPHSNKLFRNTIIELTSKSFLTDLKSEQFYTEIPGVTLFANSITDKGKILDEVFIHVKRGLVNKQQVIVAKHGEIIKKDEFENKEIVLRLTDGNISQMYPTEDRFEKIIFHEYEFPIISQNTTPGYITKDSMRSNTELREIIKTNPDAIKTRLEFFSRFTTPLQCVLFIFLGFSLGIKKGRGNNQNSSVQGFIFLLLYYIIFFVGVSLAQKGKIAPLIATSTPLIILSVIALYKFKKLDWTA